MTRTLFFLTALAAMLMAVTAVLIRIELAYPEVSALFTDADGFPDGSRFAKTATVHTMIGYLCVILLGTTMCAAARNRAAPLGRLFVSVGSVLAFGVAALMVLAELPPLGGSEATTQNVGSGVGWVLYPPLSTSVPTSLLENIGAMVGDIGLVDPLFFAVRLPQLLILPALGMLYLGAYAMLSTLPSLRWSGIFGCVLVVVVTILVIPQLMETDLPFGTVGLVALTLPLVAIASVRLIDDGLGWVLLLTLGALLTLAVQIIVLLLPQSAATNGTMLTPAMAYIFPLGLAWFALPALIIYRSKSDLSEWVVIAITACITVTLALWLAPMMQLGFLGQPQRYVDYPVAYAPLNLVVSVAVGLFALVYLVVITALRRACRPERD